MENKKERTHKPVKIFFEYMGENSDKDYIVTVKGNKSFVKKMKEKIACSDFAEKFISDDILRYFGFSETYKRRYLIPRILYNRKIEILFSETFINTAEISFYIQYTEYEEIVRNVKNIVREVYSSDYIEIVKKWFFFY